MTLSNEFNKKYFFAIEEGSLNELFVKKLSKLTHTDIDFEKRFGNFLYSQTYFWGLSSSIQPNYRILDPL
jgi:hypothetical protein